MKGNHDTKINPAVLIMRIIIGALFMGCLSFTGVAAMMHFTKQPPPANPPAPGPLGVPVVQAPQQAELPIVGYMGVAALTFAVTARFLLPSIMQPKLEPPGHIQGVDPAVEESIAVEKLLKSYQTQLIILAALAEGATFMLLVSLQAFDTTWTLPIAIFGMLWILSYFPTYDGIVAYLDEQLMNWQMRKGEG